MAANSQSHHTPIIVQYDQQLNIVHANPAALLFAGKSLSDAKGNSCYEFWGHEPDERCHNCPLHLIKESDTFTTSLVRLHDGGNWWNATVSYVFDENNEKTGVMAVYTELNDPSQPQKPFNQVLENQYLSHPTPQVIVEEHSGNIILANIALQELLGLSFEQLSHSSIYDTDIIDQSMAELLNDEIQTYGVSEGHIITVQGVTGTQQYSIQAHRIMMGDIYLLSLRLHNVTENQHLKYLLERLEQRFHSTLATTKINVWEYDLQEDRFYIYEPNYHTADDAVINIDTTSLSKAKLESVHPDDRRRVLQNISQFKRGLPVVESTYRVFDPSVNTYVHHHLRGQVTEWSKDNAPLTAQGTITDVSELYNLKEDRNRVSILHNHLFKHSPVMVLVTSLRDGKIVDANESFFSFSGFTREECLGYHPVKLGFWVDKSKWIDLAKDFKEGHSIRGVQAPLKDKNGNIHQIILSLSYVPWEGRPCALAIGIDITEEHELQQQLIQTQQRMENALNAINEGYFDLDLRTNTVFANNNCLKILGYQPGELKFSFMAWLETIHKDDRRNVVQSFRDIASGKMTEASFRLRMVKKDGSQIWILHQHKVAEYDADNSPIRIVGTITDLTKQIEIEQELKYQNETLEATFNAIDEGIWEINFKKGEITLNERGSELVKQNTQGLPVDGLNTALLEIIHPEDVNKIRQSYQKHFRGEVPLFHDEVRLLDVNGDWRWFNIRGAVIDRDKKGIPTRMVGAIADISQRKKIEMMMKLAMAGVEQTSMMAFLFKTDASIDYVNQQACVQMGYTREEFTQLKVYDLDPEFVALPEKEAIWQKNLQRISKELSYDMDVNFIRKNKTVFPATVNFRIVDFEDEQYYWVFAIDTSDMRAMEQKLRDERESLALRVEERTRQLAATNEFLDLILQALPIPIYIKNEKLEYIDVNEAFTNFFGIKKEALIGKTVTGFASKERADTVMKDDLSILHTGNRMISQDRMLNKNGEYRETVVMRQSFTNPRTGEDGIVGTFLDINDRVELQKQLEETNEELNHAMHIKDEFLANISHELRTPLTSVIGYSEMLLSGMGGKLLDNQEKYLIHIYTAGEHLLALITDILDYSKFNAEVTTLNLEMARVRSICIVALSIMEPRAFKKDVQIEFEFDDSITDLYCDPQRLRQILINLMNNAVKFSENYSSMGLRVNKLNDHIPTIEFQVWDTGIGIEPEDQVRIFEPFTQVASDLNRTYEGSGIGLALVKKFVELHEGKIWVESESGKGSVFYIHIPMKDGE